MDSVLQQLTLEEFEDFLLDTCEPGITPDNEDGSVSSTNAKECYKKEDGSHKDHNSDSEDDIEILQALLEEDGNSASFSACDPHKSSNSMTDESSRSSKILVNSHGKEITTPNSVARNETELIGNSETNSKTPEHVTSNKSLSSSTSFSNVTPTNAATKDELISQKPSSTSIPQLIDTDMFSGADDINVTHRTKIKEKRKDLPGKSEKPTQRDLFGDSDDSDWEGLDGEEKKKLQPEGQELKRLIKATNTEKSQQFLSNNVSKQATKSWKAHVSSSKPPMKSNSHPKSANEDAVVDPFSGIRVINPLVSSTTLIQRMQSRKMIKLSNLPSQVSSQALEGDWVTMGVIVSKMDSRKSAKGNTYSLWKLSDLEGEDAVSFFLFNQTYKDHWKKAVGSVIGLLNAEIMKNVEKSSKYKNELSVTIEHPDQLLLIGQSKDLGWCRGTTKSGNKCNNFLNKRHGEFCVYHVQSAYRRTSSKRADVQSGYTGVTPKAYQKKIIPSGSCVFYQGQTFTSLPNSKPKKGSVTLNALKNHKPPNAKLTTLNVYNLDEGDKEKIGRVASAKEKQFMDALQTPTVGSLNLVKHLSMADQKHKDKNNARVVNGKPVVKHITPKELIEQHRRDLLSKKRKREEEANPKTKTTNLPKTANNPTASSLTKISEASKLPSKFGQDTAKLKDKSKVDVKNKNYKATTLNIEPSVEFSIESNEKSNSNQTSTIAHISGPLSETSTSNVIHKQFNSENDIVNDGGNTPVIGRGLQPGSEVFFDFTPVSSSTVKNKENFTKQLAKKLAIAKIQAKGGIKKDSKKEKTSPNIQKKILDRLDNNITEQKDDQTSNLPNVEPPAKKSRLLGNVDLSSPDVQKLLKVTSSHTGALQHMENERKDQYFNNLEKREMYEEKMQSVKEIKCTVYSCRECGYESSFGPSPLCKQENHVVTSRTAMKKFFKCRKCQRRTVTIYKFPIAPCIDCGEHSYIRTAMMKEKAGPKLDSDNLCLRGEELKFLNSLKHTS